MILDACYRRVPGPPWRHGRRLVAACMSLMGTLHYSRMWDAPAFMAAVSCCNNGGRIGKPTAVWLWQLIINISNNSQRLYMVIMLDVSVRQMRAVIADIAWRAWCSRNLINSCQYYLSEKKNMQNRILDYFSCWSFSRTSILQSTSLHI